MDQVFKDRLVLSQVFCPHWTLWRLFDLELWGWPHLCMAEQNLGGYERGMAQVSCQFFKSSLHNLMPNHIAFLDLHILPSKISKHFCLRVSFLAFISSDAEKNEVVDLAELARKATPLSMSDLQGSFYLLALGVIISAFVHLILFIVEKDKAKKRGNGVLPGRRIIQNDQLNKRRIHKWWEILTLLHKHATNHPFHIQTLGLNQC